MSYVELLFERAVKKQNELFAQMLRTRSQVGIRVMLPVAIGEQPKVAFSIGSS